MNRKVLLVGVGISLPLLLVLGFAFRHDPQIVESPLIGKPAPSFRLADLDGNVVDLAELRGKPVVINFWATYCVPCWAEHPLLLEGSRRWQGEIHFLGVVYHDEPETIAEFNTVFGSWGPSLIDEGGRVAIAYGVYGPPETFFIDRDGVIVDKTIGPLSPDQLLDVANRMLAQPAAATG
ncbi:MAG: redoxin family protein [Holophagales bacterium]|nr:redoxin family protein [Holophagales bacterium]MYD20773.1 redoxin family protein [Holophagales bacterium]MYI33666.1 redoxin family protein [Holophagales bacterium]